jgi:hypothetical protein
LRLSHARVPGKKYRPLRAVLALGFGDYCLRLDFHQHLGVDKSTYFHH